MYPMHLNLLEPESEQDCRRVSNVDIVAGTKERIHSRNRLYPAIEIIYPYSASQGLAY